MGGSGGEDWNHSKIQDLRTGFSTPTVFLMDLWSLLALQAITLIGGFLAGAIALALGGAGGIKVLRTRQASLKDAVERIDERITHEVKTRAGRAAASARTDKDLTQEAHERMGAATPSQTGKRPSVANLRA